MKKTNFLVVIGLFSLFTIVSCNTNEETINTIEPQTILPASAKETSVVNFRKAMVNEQKNYLAESKKTNETNALAKKDNAILVASKKFLQENGVSITTQHPEAIYMQAIELYASKTQIILNPKN